MRAVAIDGDAPHMSPLAMIVVKGEVLNAAIIPESHGAWRPAEAAGELFLRAMIKQEV